MDAWWQTGEYISCKSTQSFHFSTSFHSDKNLIMTIVYGDVNLKGQYLFCFSYHANAETGGIAITPLPQSEKKPGFIMKPFFGVEPVLMDDKASVLSITKTIV